MGKILFLDIGKSLYRENHTHLWLGVCLLAAPPRDYAVLLRQPYGYDLSETHSVCRIRALSLEPYYKVHQKELALVCRLKI